MTEPDRWRWNDAPALYRAADGALVVRSARGTTRLEGDATDELVRDLADPAAWEGWTDELEETGLLARPEAPPIARFLGPTPPARIRVEAPGAVWAPLRRLLEGAGCRWTDEAPDVVLVLAVGGTPAPIREALSRWGHEARVVPAELDGAVLRVGPVATEGHACWECAEARARNNAGSPSGFEATRGAVLRPPAVPEELAGLAASLAAVATRAWLEENETLEDRQKSMDLATFAMDVAPVLAVPGCAGCARIRAGRSRAPRSPAAPRRGP